MTLVGTGAEEQVQSHQPPALLMPASPYRTYRTQPYRTRRSKRVVVPPQLYITEAFNTPSRRRHSPRVSVKPQFYRPPSFNNSVSSRRRRSSQRKSRKYVLLTMQGGTEGNRHYLIPKAGAAANLDRLRRCFHRFPEIANISCKALDAEEVRVLQKHAEVLKNTAHLEVLPDNMYFQQLEAEDFHVMNRAQLAELLDGY